MVHVRVSVVCRKRDFQRLGRRKQWADMRSPTVFNGPERLSIFVWMALQKFPSHYVTRHQRAM